MMIHPNVMVQSVWDTSDQQCSVMHFSFYIMCIHCFILTHEHDSTAFVN